MNTENNDLTEPLLNSENNRQKEENNNDQAAVTNASGQVVATGATSCSETTTAQSQEQPNDNDDSSFSYKTELMEMANLGIPLAVSFFCRMGMASTDSSFVGHISDGQHSAETYLAAAVLSDMVLNVCVTPPLAFNQVLNALVGQSMGSGNPKMAGIWLQQSCFWLSITMLPCLIGLWYVEDALVLLAFPRPLAAVAGQYAKYNVVWPVPNGLYQCQRFYFQAQGLAQPAMYNNLLFLFVNALLNWIFVFGGPFQWQGLGFIGAAISLSISRTMQCFTYFLYMFVWKGHHKATWPDATNGVWENHTRARTCEFLKQALPQIGTVLFQVVSGQVTTILVGRLGEVSIATSSALSTVTIPWSGSLGATCSTISSVRVGYHLGRGNGDAAQKSTRLVLIFITVVTAIMSILFLVPLLQEHILGIATNDPEVLDMGATLVPAMLVGAYLSLMVGNITGGVFGGMGRPLLATILSFGLELPLSIGGVAIYILVMHGHLLGVYWFQAIAGGLELLIVAVLMQRSNWQQCALDAQRRNEIEPASTNTNDDDLLENDRQDGDEATTDPESAFSSFGDDDDEILEV